MSRSSLSWSVLWLVVGACTVEAPVLDDVESASTSSQGVSYQGVSYQGVSYQGVSYQGTSYEGTSYLSTSHGATYGSTVYGETKVARTTLQLWRQLPSGQWEQRTPDRLCTWNSTRTSASCKSIDVVTTPSPLAGVRFKATFHDPDTGATRQGTLRIGTGTSDIRAVVADTLPALHPGVVATCPVQPYGGTCANPNGCRTNCDLWLYDVDLIDTDGTATSFCKPGERALALAGTWDATGAYRASSTKFTFACTNGTIAKCTRWGYRPFEQKTRKSDGTSVADMSAYHAACIRAATADYCANGHSFTKDGTLIDIYDYQPHSGAGFVPRTSSLAYVESFDASAFVWESQFDRHGATMLDFTRYAELGSVFDATGCRDRFELGTAPEPGQLHQPIDRHDSIPDEAPKLSVDNTVTCSHGEQVIGKYLHPECSSCTRKLWVDNGGLYPCLRADGAWTQQCIDDANAVCGSKFKKLALHGECTAGAALNLYDTACTIAVCGDPRYASCCTTAWTSTCVDIANGRCRGGREAALRNLGFCGTTIWQAANE